MPDVLSQNEIDELLNALQSGRESEEKLQPKPNSHNVRPYDFRTANRFPKEQIRMLHLIYDNYAGRLSTYLSGTLRTLCDVEVLSVEETTFSEFSNSLPNPAFIAIFSMPPLSGSALIDVSPVVAYEIISNLFGGTGQFHDSNKQFTEIEISILMRVISQMLSLMNECWSKVVQTNAVLDRVETSSQFAQIVAGNEPNAIITLSVKIGDVEGIMNFCLPHVAIQPIAKQLASKTWYTDTAPAKPLEPSKLVLSPRIANTTLTLRAVLDPTYATIRDILSLQVGDVIRVDHHIDKNITINVEHMPKFRGHIGIQGSRFAVKICEILREASPDE